MLRICALCGLWQNEAGEGKVSGLLRIRRNRAGRERSGREVITYTFPYQKYILVTAEYYPEEQSSGTVHEMHPGGALDEIKLISMAFEKSETTKDTVRLVLRMGLVCYTAIFPSGRVNYGRRYKTTRIRIY